MRREVLCGSMCALLVIGGGVAVRAADRDNVVRFGIVWISPTGDLTTDGFFVEPVDEETRIEFQGDLTMEPDDAVGAAISYERRFTDLLGLEVGFFGAQHDISGRLAGTLQLIRNADNVILDELAFDETDTIGDIMVTPWTAGVNFHLTPAKPVDLYLGPYLAYVFYGDLDIEGEKIPIEDEFTFGVVVGIDVPFHDSRWTFNASGRYLHTQAQLSESGPDSTMDVDPYVLQAGLGFRF
jgi:outer membrane protein W